MSKVVSALDRAAARVASECHDAREGDAQPSGATVNGRAPAIDAGAWAAEDAAPRVARLYRELFPAVFGFIRFRVGDGHVAEELTATVFERALAKLASVRDPERVRGWLFTIARNVVADDRRRRRSTASLAAVELLEHLWVDSPERLALDRDEWRRLVGYLAELDERDREILGLRFAAGLTNREVGQVVGRSEANVAQITHRAVVKLRRRFAHEEASR
jgi:RNA polymerase sigma factor (sigma-70 family)